MGGAVEDTGGVLDVGVIGDRVGQHGLAGDAAAGTLSAIQDSHTSHRSQSS